MNPACGDRLILTLEVSQGRISQARFMAEGCAATRAAGSCLTELSLGCSPEELAQLTPETISKALNGLPSGRFHAAELASRVARLAAQELS